MALLARASVAALLVFAAVAQAALAHGGGGADYISEIRAVAPAGAVEVEVLDRDDRLLVENRSGSTIVVEGYDREPYARIGADGTVEVNRRSPALYLNEDRYARVDLPARADGDAAPEWEVVDRSGRFEWHDHRIHWMGSDRPEAVRDPKARTKVFDWEVPLRVGSRAGAVEGTLFWVGERSGGPPVAAGVALAVVLLAGLGLVVAVRRRRRRGGGRAEAEAW